MTATSTPPGRLEQCTSSTAFTIDIRDAGSWTDAVCEVVSWLHQVDAVFSTYKPDSDISRIRRGELRVTEAHPDVFTVLDLCAQVQTRTGGYFTAMPSGRLDPTGLVKGWAIERASELLRQHGSPNHAVNGGGDLRVAGRRIPAALASATVAGPSQTYADAYATAAFVMGPEALRWTQAVEAYETLLVAQDGTVRASAGWSARFSAENC
ncbi:MAG: FAD:protein FMN transferase [Jatrophihabitantaceae bacterium]